MIWLSLAWRFRYALLAGAVIAGLLGWHVVAVNKAYHRGEATERAAWEEVKRRAEQARYAERQQAQAKIAEIAQRHAADEATDEAEAKRLRDDLARAQAEIGAGLDTCSIPDSIIAPLRSVR